MALPLTESGALSAYSPASRLKIQQYLEEGRVLLAPGGAGAAVRASIAGNRPRPYQVTIGTGSVESLETAACDCPALGRCVHIGAAWIAHLRSQALPDTGTAAARDAALESLRRSLDAATATPESGDSLAGRVLGDAEYAAMVNPLDEDAPVPSPLEISGSASPEALELIDRLFAAPGTAGDCQDRTGERWAVGFLLDGQPVAGGPGLGGMRRQLVVRPVLRFVRQDGQPGRHKEWRAEGLTVQPGGQERRWLDCLLAGGGSLPVEQLIILGELPDGGGLPELRMADGQPISPAGEAALELAFRPAVERYSRRELVFRAEWRLAGGGREARVVTWSRGGRYLVFLGEGGILSWRRAEPRLAALLEAVDGLHGRLDPPAIELLAARLAADPIAGLGFSWTGSCLERRQARGQPMLTVEAGIEGVWGNGPRRTLISLDFEWDGLFEAAGLPEGWRRHVDVDTADGGQTVLWVRDLAWEGRVQAWLERLMAERGLPAEPDPEDAPSPFTDRYRARPDGSGGVGGGTGAAWRTVLPMDQRQFLSDHGGAFMDEGFGLRLRRDGPPARRGSVGIHVDRGMDWLEIEAAIQSLPAGGAPGRRKRLARQARLKATDAARREELSAVQDLLKGGFARTAAGLVRLEPGDAGRLRRLIDAGLEAGKRTRVALANIAQLAALHDESTSHVREIGRARELVDKLERMDSLAAFDPPPDFNAELRGYQRRGYDWLLHMRQAGLGACLADDMGLGKTVQALAVLRRLAADAAAAGRGFRALLVVPVSTLPNWQSEAGRFTPGLGVLRHGGADRANGSPEAFAAATAGAALILVSYATLRQDLALFASAGWDVMLLDEAHTIKNPESATFTAVRSVPAAWRLSLTGTPVENSVQDLWAQMEFLNPGVLGSLKRFRARYGTAIEERRDDAARDTLRRIVSPFVLRRRKEDVARDLPPKEEITLELEMDEAQRRVYADIRDACRLKVDEAVRREGINRSALTILEALLRLRQACLMPAVINPAWEEAGSVKLDALLGLLEDIAAEGHKALVFSQFTGMLGRIRSAVAGRGLACCYLDGESTDRADSIARFQADPAVPVFLLSLKAGGVGINLTAADYVILFDPWWNPAVEAQAIDRAHRIGQDKPVIVYRLVVRGTVEEKIRLLQERKRSLAGSLVSGDEGLIRSLDPGELGELLG
jgi:superfamily II DNA or RNA helicase